MNEAAEAKRMKPTTKQLEVYEFVRGYIDQNIYGPTLQEIADEFEWASINTSKCHIAALIKKGKLASIPGKRRTIRLSA